MLTLVGGGKHIAYFSFKFNEIKFCTLLMNWLSREKMYTYFCNKFRSVNCMYCIKCGVNSSLLIILAAAYGLWYLGSLFYHDTQYSQRG